MSISIETFRNHRLFLLLSISLSLSLALSVSAYTYLPIYPSHVHI